MPRYVRIAVNDQPTWGLLRDDEIESLAGPPEGISPMQPGDTIEIRVSGIGSLTNQVVAERPY